MKHRPYAPILACALVVRFACAPASADPQPYESTRIALKASAVRVLLPQPIPAVVGPVRSIAVITADRNGYYVGFSPVVNCAGGLSCAFFHVAGYRPSARGAVAQNSRRVRLDDGTAGFYRPEDCSGASCTEATLTFERGGAEYELDVKATGDELRILQTAYRYLRPLPTLDSSRQQRPR